MTLACEDAPCDEVLTLEDCYFAGSLKLNRFIYGLLWSYLSDQYVVQT